MWKSHFKCMEFNSRKLLQIKIIFYLGPSGRIQDLRLSYNIRNFHKHSLSHKTIHGQNAHSDNQSYSSEIHKNLWDHRNTEKKCSHILSCNRNDIFHNRASKVFHFYDSEPITHGMHYLARIAARPKQ